MKGAERNIWLQPGSDEWLAAVFMKTDVKRQSELVRMILSSVNLFRSKGDQADKRI
jgi:hypothetical protein